MPPEVVARLLEPFFQPAWNLVRSRGGLGVKLALCHGIVEQHGGTIAANSRGDGHGSAFVIELAVDKAVDPAQPPKSQS